jgi:hypothetical protein
MAQTEGLRRPSYIDQYIWDCILEKSSDKSVFFGITRGREKDVVARVTRGDTRFSVDIPSVSIRERVQRSRLGGKVSITHGAEVVINGHRLEHMDICTVSGLLGAPEDQPIALFDVPNRGLVKFHFENLGPEVKRNFSSVISVGETLSRGHHEDEGVASTAHLLHFNTCAKIWIIFLATDRVTREAIARAGRNYGTSNQYLHEIVERYVTKGLARVVIQYPGDTIVTYEGVMHSVITVFLGSKEDKPLCWLAGYVTPPTVTWLVATLNHGQDMTRARGGMETSRKNILKYCDTTEKKELLQKKDAIIQLRKTTSAKKRKTLSNLKQYLEGNKS